MSRKTVLFVDGKRIVAGSDMDNDIAMVFLAVDDGRTIKPLTPDQWMEITQKLDMGYSEVALVRLYRDR